MCPPQLKNRPSNPEAALPRPRRSPPRSPVPAASSSLPFAEHPENDALRSQQPSPHTPDSQPPPSRPAQPWSAPPSPRQPRPAPAAAASTQTPQSPPA